MATEEWRDIPDYEGLYQASSEGRFRRITRFRKVAAGLFEPAATSPVASKQRARNGYVQVRLSNGAAKTLLAHRLVCIAFHGPPPSKNHEVAHWDGAKDNNRAANLRWASKVENAADRRRHGNDRLGSAHALSKLNTEQVIQIRQRHQMGEALTSLGREYGVTPTLILNIVNRKTWKHI